MFRNNECKDKLKSVLMIIFIILSVFNLVVVVGAATTETISIGSASTEPGSTVTLPITISNTANATGVSFDIVFDENIVEIDSITANNSTVSGSSVTPNIDNTTGKASVALTNTNPITTTSPTSIIDVTFHVVGTSGSTNLDLQNGGMSDESFNLTTPNLIDGNITISSTQSGTETISIGSASTESGSTVTLPITISNTTNTTGVSFDIVFDKNIVEIDSITTNNSTVSGSSVTPNIDNTNGTASVALTNTNPITTTSPTHIIDVTFHVVGTTGNTTIDLQNVEFSGDNFNATSPEIVNDGKIQINDTCSSCVYVNWNATISATNQLEPVYVGMHPNASDGYDNEFDVYAVTPEQGKVTLTIDSLYAKSIKKSLLPGNNVSWNISMGVPAGQITSLDWNMYPDPSIALHIYNGTDEISSATTFSEGNHSFIVVAEILENINFNLHLNPGWNMVSLPLTPNNSSVDAVFGEISTLNIQPVVSWQSPLFITAEKIEPKKGYWVFAPQNMDIIITGTPIADTTISLSKGWNMIGTVGLNKLDLTQVPNQVSQIPPVIWQSPLFVPSNELESGKAAWLFVTKNTEVVI